MGTKYELSLKSNYVKYWGVSEALRELFQNAIDQEATSGFSYRYEYDAKTQTLILVNPHSWLDRATLLLGESTKEDDATTIGQFGEGYKLACLVLVRMGLSVTIHNQNYNENWVPFLKSSKRYNGREILIFDIDGRIKYKHTEDKDLIFKVENLTPDMWKAYTLLNLNIVPTKNTIETSLGDILLEGTYKGKVFVSGLYVGSMDNLKYGYNFNPEVLPLDRDRRVLPSFDTLCSTSNMWSQTDSDLIIKLLKDSAPDVSYIESRVIKVAETPVAEEAYKEFVEENGEDAYPVSSDKELKALAAVAPELKPVIVSNSYSAFLSQTGKLPAIDVKHISSIKGRLELWRDKIGDRLSEEEIKEFNDIIKYIWN